MAVWGGIHVASSNSPSADRVLVTPARFFETAPFPVNPHDEHVQGGDCPFCHFMSYSCGGAERSPLFVRAFPVLSHAICHMTRYRGCQLSQCVLHSTFFLLVGFLSSSSTAAEPLHY